MGLEILSKFECKSDEKNMQVNDVIDFI